MDSSSTTEAVVRLARCGERGAEPPLPLILQCLQRVAHLDLSASGGDALLWMLFPVLRAAQSKLQELCHDRHDLEVEVPALRAKLEQLSMDVESECGSWRRAEEKAKGQLKGQHEAARRLERTAARLQQELAEVRAETSELRRQADEGLAAERESWARERQKFEEEIADLSVKSKELDVKLDYVVMRGSSSSGGMGSPSAQLQAAKDKLRQLYPSLSKQEEVARRLEDRQTKVQEARLALDVLAGKGHGKKKNKKKKQGTSQGCKEAQTEESAGEVGDSA